MIFNTTPFFTPEQRKMIESRSGNPKSIAFPCEETPKSVKHLRDAAPNTGHDLHLNGLPLLVDFIASKRLRVLLLAEYGKFTNVVSSASLMHKPELSDVSVEGTPCTFQYGMSVVVNLRLIKKMCAELCTIRHIDGEVDELVVELEKVLTEHNIKVPDPLPVTRFEEADFKGLLEYCKGCWEEVNIMNLSWIRSNRCIEIALEGLNLSMYEQLLRYNSGILLIKRGYYGLFRDDYTIGDRAFSCTLVMMEDQARIIVEQRKNHKLKDWQIICKALERSI